MPKDKNKRNSTPRGSQLVGDSYVHTETMQKVFCSMHVCAVYRYTLKPGEEFSSQAALKLIDKYLKKRQSHNEVNLLETRITFERTKSSGKEPLRRWVGYSEIVDVQAHKTKKQFFVISIHAEQSRQRYYEVYKTKSKELTDKFIDTIKQARADPEFRIRDKNAIKEVVVSDKDDRHRSMTHIEFQTSTDDEIETCSQDSLPEVINNKEVIHAQHAPPPPSPLQPVEVLPVRAVARSPSPLSRRGKYFNGMHDVTFIQYFAKYGPKEVDDGPVYMYMERKPISENMHNGTV